MIIALRHEHFDTARMMLNHVRIDPNYFNPPHFPPFMECCANGWMDALNLLLENPRVDVNMQMVRRGVSSE